MRYVGRVSELRQLRKLGIPLDQYFDVREDGSVYALNWSELSDSRRKAILDFIQIVQKKEAP